MEQVATVVEIQQYSTEPTQRIPASSKHPELGICSSLKSELTPVTVHEEVKQKQIFENRRYALVFVTGE